jgi:hypothetical protein
LRAENSQGYEAMQMVWRKRYIEKIELRQFKKYGLIIKDKDIFAG